MCLKCSNLNLSHLKNKQHRGADAGVAVDLHPEKRMKASYLEFEEENLERLKKVI